MKGNNFNFNNNIQDNKKRKKNLFQRQAHLATIPDDLLSKITPQINFSNSFNSQSSSFGSSSLPLNSGIFTQQSNFNTYNSYLKLYFFNSSKYGIQYPQQSVIINCFTRDINEVIKEIILNRPFIQYIPHNTQISHICPLSKTPIICPGRSTFCNHSQSFDLREFILLQMDDDWKCPICNLSIDFESLRFDPFFFKNSNLISNSIEDFSHFDINQNNLYPY